MWNSIDKYKKKRDFSNVTAKSVFIFWTVSAVLLLSGCAATELENKSFPLAVLVGEQYGQCRVCYLSQDLAEIANENADGENVTSASAMGSTYYEAQKAFEKNNRCQLDLSHTKVLILQKSLLEKGKLSLFLETVRRENMYARNTLVFLSDDTMKAMADLNSSLEVPLGSYLEQMMENEQDIKGQAAVTLGTLLNEQANEEQTILIPMIRDENGLPVIHAYTVLQDFEQKGQTGVEEAQIYYLMENQLQQMELQLAKGEQIRLTGLKCKRDYYVSADYAAIEAAEGMKGIQGRKTAAAVTGRLTITANAHQITGSGSAEETEAEIKRMLQEKISDICSSNQKDAQIDLSDSYRYLPRYAPDIYRIYQNSPGTFREILNYQIQVEVNLI